MGWTCVTLYLVHCTDERPLNLIFCSELRFYLILYLDEHALALYIYRHHIFASGEFSCLGLFSLFVSKFKQKIAWKPIFTQHYVHVINIVHKRGI